MPALICGSLAYDTIMQFDGKFSDAILPDQLYQLNVAFLVPTLRREFGGCAGNIGYNLKLLGGEPRIMATIGQDGAPYLSRLTAQEIAIDQIRVVEDTYTAQAFITTDAGNNQITAFHPGAMMQSHLNKVSGAGSVELAIIAPDGRDGMLQHAHDCAAANIPFIFDPGQGLPMFNGSELRQLIELASYVAVNEYEAELLRERTGLTTVQIAERVSAFIVTQSERGADIYHHQQVTHIPGVPADAIVDPTGCGDAFRAGMLHGLQQGMDWATTGRIASVMGAIKIAHQGGQNHNPDQAEIAQRFFDAFGYRI